MLSSRTPLNEGILGLEGHPQLSFRSDNRGNRVVQCIHVVFQDGLF